jgi:hypothetical protein
VPRSITDDDVEALIVPTLEQTPADATHWSTRSMAKATGTSQSAESRIWRAFGLKPHLVDLFKLSPDPLFVEKVRDVVSLYLNPPEGALVLCVDEKTQIQALDRSRSPCPRADRTGIRLPGGDPDRGGAVHAFRVRSPPGRARTESARDTEHFTQTSRRARYASSAGSIVELVDPNAHV